MGSIQYQAVDFDAENMDKGMNARGSSVKQWGGTKSINQISTILNLKALLTGGVPRLLTPKGVYLLLSSCVAYKGLEKCRIPQIH